jgi:hypothetical protein
MRAPMLTETVSALLVDSLKKLLVTLVTKRAGDEMKGYFSRRRLETTVERCALSTAESLAPYFEHEHIAEPTQKVVVDACVATLKPLVDDSDKLLRGSLDPERVFLLAHPQGVLPKVVLDEGAGQVYALVARQVCALLCEMPGAIEGWEQAKWREDYRRFDDIAAGLKEVSAKLDANTRERREGSDRLLSNIRQMQEQQSRLNLTGLRAERPVLCQFDKMFVNPALAYSKREASGFSSTHEITGGAVSSKLLGWGARSLVFGAPGAGKTTWCHWLRSDAVSDTVPHIGLVVHLRSIQWNDPPSLARLLRGAAGTHLAEQVTAEHVSRWIAWRSIVVLVDGFDEVAPATRPDTLRWLRELALMLDQCPLVVTSRPIATGELDALDTAWTSYELLAFDEPRIVRFIENWHTHAWPDDAGGAPVDAQALATQWSKDPTIEPLTGNPLLLSTLLVVHKLDGRLPEGRAELYRRYVHGMIGIWAHEVSTPGVSLNPEQKRSALTGLALHMQLHEVDEIDEATALSILTKGLERLSSRDVPAVVLQMLCERTGLFVGPGSYGFTHKSIGEFLVAEAVVQGDRLDGDGRRIDRFRLREERFNDRWKTVLFLWAGLAPVCDVEDFFESISTPLSAEDASVLGGLLMDQGHRLSPERRVEFLRRLMTVEFEPKHSYSLIGYAGFKCAARSLRLLELSSGGRDLRSCFSMALARGDLPWAWPQAWVSKSAMRSLWLVLGGHAEKATVAQLVTWASESTYGPFEWAVSMAIERWFAAARASDEVLALACAFAAHQPHAPAIGALAIADHCCQSRHTLERGIESIHALAHEIDLAAFPPGTLDGTQNVINWEVNRFPRFDLLREFEARLQALPETTLPTERAVCLDLFQKLRALRDSATNAASPAPDA